MLINAADPDLCKNDGDVAISVAIPAGRIGMGRVIHKLLLKAHALGCMLQQECKQQGGEEGDLLWLLVEVAVNDGSRL